MMHTIRILLLLLVVATPAFAQEPGKSTAELEGQIAALQKQARDKDAKIAEQQQAIQAVQKTMTAKDMARIWTRLFKEATQDPLIRGCRQAGGRAVTKVDRQRQTIVFDACEF